MRLKEVDSGLLREGEGFGTCTPVFMAVLFTIAKTWKEPKCPSIEEWIKKMRYIQ